MIKIYYSSYGNKLDDATFLGYVEMLPLKIKKKILRYRRWQDAQASLYGKLLLINALQDFGLSADLTNLRFTKYGRPYIEGKVDFNISHSGSYVVCAISEGKRIGIDVEEIIPILISDFKDLFSDEEWNIINQAEDTNSKFYYYWTAKEAVSKSEGKGLSNCLNNIAIRNGSALFENKVWYYKNVSLLPNYMLQVASDKKIENIEIEQKYFS